MSYKIHKISVIIPVYNVEKYIKECLDSVTNQTFRNLEIICIDDCGTDNSMQIVEEYKQNDDRITIIKHNKNKGLGVSKNTGIDASTGDYIFFLDSDDYIKLDILEKLYKKIIEAASDVVVSRTNIFPDEEPDDATKKRIQDIKNYLDFTPIDIYKVTPENYKEAIIKVSCVSWGKLYLASFIKSNNLKFADPNVIHEDDGFNVKMLSQFPQITMIDDLGVMYRIRKSALSANMEDRENLEQKIKNVQRSLNDAIKYLKKNCDKKLVKELVTAVKTSTLYSWYFKEFYFYSIFYRKWHKNDKLIRIFGIKFFRNRTNANNEKLIALFEVPIYRSKV